MVHISCWPSARAVVGEYGPEVLAIAVAAASGRSVRHERQRVTIGHYQNEWEPGSESATQGTWDRLKGQGKQKFQGKCRTATIVAVCAARYTAIVLPRSFLRLVRVDQRALRVDSSQRHWTYVDIVCQFNNVTYWASFFPRRTMSLRTSIHYGRYGLTREVNIFLWYLWYN